MTEQADEANIHLYKAGATLSQINIDDVLNEHTLKDGLQLRPDKFDKGEKKFVKNFAKYITDNPEKFKDFDVYLMRNIEILKSIGIYLNDDTEVFYPDFIIWLIAKEKIYMNFIDPKGLPSFQLRSGEYVVVPLTEILYGAKYTNQR